MGQHMGNIESFSNLVQINIKYCMIIAKLNGLIYSSSVWDLNSAKNIVNLNPFIKIGSATNLNFEVLDFLCSNFTGKIHLSLGMTTQSEEEKIISFFEKKNRSSDLIIYACTSAYPVDSKDVCLLEIKG